MKKKTAALFCISILALIATIIFSDKTAYSQAKAAEKKTDTCITSECHAKMGKDKFVHGPVAAGQCTICHGESAKHKESPKSYKFGKIKNIQKACYSCHDKFKAKKFTHKPVEDGDCTACHAPHGSSYKFQLLAQGGALCFNCHDDKIIAGNFVHGPAAVGGCVACHDSHTADYAKNLKDTPPALCYSCHTDKVDKFQKAKFMHKPVAENCVKCHNPHSAAKQFMLSNESPALCLDCHKDKKDYIEKVAVKHGALTTGKGCVNCHDPHISDIAKMLPMPPMDLCLSCHDKSLKTSDNKSLADMKKLFAENTDHHGPIKQKDCSGCHNTHGSNNFRILREPYPAVFYMPYSPENYALCFSCHDKIIVKDPETTKLTNFRNGEVNLHFKHVNKSEKGRTCRACHETHASNHPKHIRDTVPFGTWDLPVNFQKTETGGGCTPGCHKLKKYDRVKKEQNL